MNNINEMLGKMTEFLQSEAKTETIIGKQFQLGEYTCVPVMQVGMGFGGGGGEGKGKQPQGKSPGEGEGTGAGGGAGLGLGPVGFLVTRGGEIQFVPTRNTRGLGATLEKIPDLIEKYLEKNKKAEKAEAV